jgi:hypothetical protein
MYATDSIPFLVSVGATALGVQLHLRIAVLALLFVSMILNLLVRPYKTLIYVPIFADSSEGVITISLFLNVGSKWV